MAGTLTFSLHKTRKLALAVLLLAGLIMGGFSARTIFAATGACTAPSTDYGTDTTTVSIPATGTYQIWTRMSAPSTSANTYMLQIDTASCFTIGGTGVPVYASGATTFFANNGTNWTDKTSTGAVITTSLSAGTHNLSLIGNAAGVVVDRLVFTQDTTCVPTGTGDNCANPPDTTPPSINLTGLTSGASVTANTTVTANATDDVAVAKVEFYVDGTLKTTDTTSPYTYVVNPTTLGVGSHSIYGIAYDTSTSGNPTNSATISFTVPDSTPPTVSAVSATNITQTGATITWTTNEAADSQVQYGTSTSYGSTTTLDSTKVTSHSVSIAGLTAGTLYHFKVASKDAAGNAATGVADATFTTQAIAGDTTAPALTITAPAAGTVSGTVTFSATATDNVGVTSVVFKYGATVIGTDTSSPYSVSWNTTGLANGSYTLTATASDAAGNTTPKTVAVTVNNTTVQAADINSDGSVNFLDLSILSSQFGKSGSAITSARADINGDGTVNFLDLSALAAKYGT